MLIAFHDLELIAIFHSFLFNDEFFFWGSPVVNHSEAILLSVYYISILGGIIDDSELVTEIFRSVPINHAQGIFRLQNIAFHSLENVLYFFTGHVRKKLEQVVQFFLSIFFFGRLHIFYTLLHNFRVVVLFTVQIDLLVLIFLIITLPAQSEFL